MRDYYTYHDLVHEEMIHFLISDLDRQATTI